MSEQYVVLERADLGSNGLIAVPKTAYETRANGADTVYQAVGELTGLTPNSFEKHDHWGINFLPIHVAGSLATSTSTSNAAISKGLEAICTHPGARFDRERLAQDSALANHILDYEITEGQVYVVQFNGKQVDTSEAVTRSTAFLVAPSDGNLTCSHNQLAIGGQTIAFPEGDLRYMLASDMYDGDIAVFASGIVRAHRKLLKPFESRGQYARQHSNGPWFVLEDNLGGDHVNRMRAYFGLSE